MDGSIHQDGKCTRIQEEQVGVEDLQVGVVVVQLHVLNVLHYNLQAVQVVMPRLHVLLAVHQHQLVVKANV
jgi:hypothetical protein